MVEVLVELAEHSSHREFAVQVTDLIVRLDHDDSFDDLADSVEGRRASVVEVGGEVAVAAHGGDPVQADQMRAIFDAFAEAEYRADVEARRADHDDDADAHPISPTPAQRGFDALRDLRCGPCVTRGSAPARPGDQPRRRRRDRRRDARHAGLALPTGAVVELDESGEIDVDGALPSTLADDLRDDPAAFLDRHCETEAGTPIHPSVVLRALLTGHIRRVVMDSRGVIVDHGTKQRLFTGLARTAAMLMARRCEHPGCDLPARSSQVDHNVEWNDGGRTDQDDRTIRCGHRNRLKHRQRWRTRRDARGRAYTIRDDGTIVLPVGEREPDLTIDELTEAARSRLHRDVVRLGNDS